MPLQVYIIPKAEKKKLRDIWLESGRLENGDGYGEEISGIFRAEEVNKNTFHLFISKVDNSESSFTYKGSNGAFTVSGSGEDNPFCFHTHPIQTDLKGNLVNYPNIISNEDLIGVTQDSNLNTGLTSNPNGILKFDIILCPIGIYVYSATQTIIDKYIEFEPKITNETVLDWIKVSFLYI